MCGVNAINKHIPKLTSDNRTTQQRIELVITGLFPVHALYEQLAEIPVSSIAVTPVEIKVTSPVRV